MTTPNDTTWTIEPHTQAKHEILRRYLAAWFPILASGHGRIVYIDGFCGPGRYVGGEPGSPVIALESAMQHSARLSHREIVFLFLDSDERRIAHLGDQLAQIRIPSNFSVHPQHGQFDIELRQLLDRLENSNLRLAPTFAFVDPFGFKGVPFDLLSRLLAHQSTEVLVYFPVDSINRWLEHPEEKTRQHILELLGVPDIENVLRSPGNRVNNLRLLYQNQLASVARFVRFFEMCNTHNRPIYDLFFASNNRLGHKKMKEAFWKIDPARGYQFSDATNPNQLLLFSVDPVPELVEVLHKRFLGRAARVDEVIVWVDDETPYIESHVRPALKSLEASETISVNPLKADGTKRRKNSFTPDTIVHFAK